jgi:hypothetical protein
MSWLISAKQYIPAVIGEPFGGGFFAGYISHTADNSPTHALIVAPRATGATGTGYTLTTNLLWKTTASASAGTASDFDGVSNTLSMTATTGLKDEHPAAKFCVDLAIGGFTDWYLPARFELDIAYFNLKPGTAVNNTAAGVNAYSVPKRNASYTPDYPGQTSLSSFNTSTEAFGTVPHWCSTESTQSSNNGFTLSFSNGQQVLGTAKTNTATRVRAFRRIAL